MPREYYVYPDGTPIAIAGNNEYATQIPMSASNATDVYTAINAKVSKSGDTMTGPLTLSGTQVERPGGNTSWINGRDVAPVKTTSGGDAWNPVVSAKSVNGAWGIGTLNDALYFSYGTDAQYNAGTNTTNNYSIDANGNFSGKASNVTGTVAIDHGGTGATSKTAAGTNLGFNWSGQGGQPTWLWGGNSHGTYYVYNPSNFSVNKANSATNATNATTATNLKGSKAGLRFYAGTSVVNPNGGNACRLIYASTLNTYFGVSNCSNGNTALFISNGDSGAWDGHFEGCTWLVSEKAWWATFASSRSGNVRLNWLAVYFG